MISKERIEELIKRNAYVKSMYQHDEELIHIYEDTGTILQSELERQGCEYCNMAFGNNKMWAVESGEFEIGGNPSYLHFNKHIPVWGTTIRDMTKINYCPMCGKKLGGE